ncbi:hypothetical protein AAMO2058_001677400 [Amorphochlora amoebiformis]
MMALLAAERRLPLARLWANRGSKFRGISSVTWKRSLNDRSKLNRMNDAAKMGDMHTTRGFLEEMEGADQGTARTLMNTHMKACMRAGNLASAEKAYEEMIAAGVHPNSRTFGKLVTAARKARNLKAVLFWELKMKQSGIKSQPIVATEVITARATLGDISGAEKLFGEVVKKHAGCDEKVSYIGLMRGYLQDNDVEAVEFLTKRMLKHGPMPDGHIFSIVLEACRFDAERSEYWVEVMKQIGIHPDEVHHQCMIRCWNRARNAQKSAEWKKRLELYRELRTTQNEKNPPLQVETKASPHSSSDINYEDIRSKLKSIPKTFNNIPVCEHYWKLLRGQKKLAKEYRSMIALYSHGFLEKAEGILMEMQAEGMEITIQELMLMVIASTKSGNVAKAEHYFERAFKMGVNEDIPVSFRDYHLRVASSSLMTAYRNKEDGSKAEGVISRMEEAKIQPDVVTLTSMIALHANAGMLERALYWFDEIKKRGMEPTKKTYSGVLLAYGCSEGFEEAEVLREMNSMGITPTRHNICTVIKSWMSKPEGFKRIQSLLKEWNMQLDPSEVCTLVKLCKYMNEPKVALEIAEKFLNYFGENVSADTNIHARVLTVVISLAMRAKDLAAVIRNYNIFKKNRYGHTVTVLRAVEWAKNGSNRIKPEALGQPASNIHPSSQLNLDNVDTSRVSEDIANGNLIIRKASRFNVAMIRKCVADRRVDQAEVILEEMRRQQIRVGIREYCAMCAGCADIGNIPKAEEYLDLALSDYKDALRMHAPHANLNYAFARLTRAYESKYRKPKIVGRLAEGLIRKMDEAKVAVSIVVLTNIIRFFAVKKNREKALFWFDQMLQRGIKPNEYTYSAIIIAHLTQDDLESAEGVLKDMDDIGLYI